MFHTIFIFIFTLLAYLGSLWLFRKSSFPLLHPLITSSALIIVMLNVMGYSYEEFKKATQVINFLLGPSVVALGWALYKQIETLKANLASILASITVGSLVGIVSVMGVLRLFGVPLSIEASLLPKSVTTPIAIQIAERSGGIVSLTAVIVILTGIFGGIVAPFVFRKIGITDSIAKGLALGTAAHGVGTARAMEMGAVEGALSGLAIGVAGLVTTLLVPLVELIF
ncbi:LrgA-associated membrane protein LrgB [Mucinivorans hirudinis]|uniref:LrgA-associated membrane protein LrgB n=1 Tax=Mucinivorans hirudinis TaxID=1433126 RepID=A0A060RA96_9BACT|nr:LrgA-associated membrane protein LrgB [Mucinivorans hirudinis]